MTAKLGLVVGKFSPLHRGHEFLIAEAARRSERLLILSYSSPELPSCTAERRGQWLAARAPGHEAIVFDDAILARFSAAAGVDPRAIPANDSPDRDHQLFLAWLLRDVLKRTPDAFFCSESYGPPCAETLTRELARPVRAVLIDPARAKFPVSATQIRNGAAPARDWLAPEVRATFARRIAILGGESSGKTTLAKALADRFQTVWAHEYGRELWEKQGGIGSEGDLLHIAEEQIRREDTLLTAAKNYLFCDTTPLTTLGYSYWMFGQADARLQVYAQRLYDGIILCLPDFPFVQDGTRREPEFAAEQHAWYKARLADAACPVLEVGGRLAARVAMVERWLGARDR
jgi:HTH-type transcriptional repressor of NAD biosynthesis genes